MIAFLNINYKILITLILVATLNIIGANQQETRNVLVNKIDSLNELSFSLRGINPTKTIVLGKKANSLAKEIGYSKGILMSFNFIGVGYRNLFDYSSSVEYYLQAFNLADSINDIEQKAYTLNNIGNIYYRQENDSLALKSLYEALELAYELSNIKIIAYCYLNLGRVYTHLEQWDDATFYFQNAVRLREEIGNQLDIANIYVDIGAAMRKMKDYQSAMNTLSKALKIASQLDNGKLLIAETYFEFGLLFKDLNNYKKSIEYLQKSLSISKIINNNKTIVESYKLIHENYALLGDYKKAYQFFMIYNSYKDSLLSIESSRTIADLEIKYETEKKEKDNKLLRQQNMMNEHQIADQKSYTQSLVIIISLVVILAFILLTIARQKTRTNKILSNKNIEIEKQRSELANLNVTKDKFFSIISHDLKSPFTGLLGSVSMLNEIYDELTDEERKTILSGMYQSTKKIQELLIGLLDWARSQQDKIEINPETITISEMVNSLFSVYKSISEEKKIKMINKLPKDLVIFTDKNILNTVLRNLIANALKFTAKNGEIKIYHDIKEKCAKITVQDNGVGISESDQKKLFRIDEHLTTKGTANESGTGIGLILCHELLTKQGCILGVKSKKDFGSKFFFTVPLHKSNGITGNINTEITNYNSTKNS